MKTIKDIIFPFYNHDGKFDRSNYEQFQDYFIMDSIYINSLALKYQCDESFIKKDLKYFLIEFVHNENKQPTVNEFKNKFNKRLDYYAEVLLMLNKNRNYEKK